MAALVGPGVEAVKRAHADGLTRVELYTGALTDLPGPERRSALNQLSDAARLAAKLGIEVGLAGGLGYRSLREVLEAAPAAERVAVGRAALARAMLVGLDQALRDLRALARVTRALWPLASAAQMRALDRHTIETLGVPGELLMESAGRAVAEAVLALLRPARRCWWSAAPATTAATAWSRRATCTRSACPCASALLVERRGCAGTPRGQLARARDAGVAFEGERWRAPAAGVIVDAIFGTGLARDVSGRRAACIRRIDAARAAHPARCAWWRSICRRGCAPTPVRCAASAVRRTCTLTLGLPKLGLALEPGRWRAGRIRVARIGIATRRRASRTTPALWTRAGAARRLPRGPRPATRVPSVTRWSWRAREGKTGAAALAAQGAARIGAGLVTIACPAGLHDVLEIKLTEAMTAPLPDTAARALAAARGAGDPRARRDARRRRPRAGDRPRRRDARSRARGREAASSSRSRWTPTRCSRSRASSELLRRAPRADRADAAPGRGRGAARLHGRADQPRSPGAARAARAPRAARSCC